MRCNNCACELRLYERGGLICDECRLIHDGAGTPEGWIVCAHSTPGGVIPYQLLTPFRGDQPLSSAQVAVIIRLAAEIGVRNIQEIRRRLDQEALGVVIQHQIERITHDGVVDA